MKKSTITTLLIIFYILSLGARLILSFQTPHFGLDHAYFTQRQVESIFETGLPIHEDPLSFSGKEQVFSPLLYYLITVFNLFLPFGLVGKILPNLLASTVVFFSFLLARHITKNDHAALFTAFISGFIPVFFAETINSISPSAFILPLMLYQAYCFLNPKTHLTSFIVLSFLLPLFHPLAVLFSLSLVVFLLLSSVERFTVDKNTVELVIFNLTITLWILLIFFKNAFLFHGATAIFNNTPLALIGERFLSFDLLRTVYLIGIIPSIYGAIAAYQFLFKKRNAEGFLLLSLVFTPFILLVGGFIDVTLGLMFLGIFVTVLFAYYYDALEIYLKKTRFSKLRYYRYYFVVSVTLTFIVTSIIPSLFLGQGAILDSLSSDEHEALSWIQKNTPQDSVIFGSIQEGDVITGIAKRKTIIGPHFLLVRDIAPRYEDYRRIIVSPFKIETIQALNRYDANYLYLSKRIVDAGLAQEKFEDDCFKKVFINKEVTIYELTCDVRT